MPGEGIPRTKELLAYSGEMPLQGPFKDSCKDPQVEEDNERRRTVGGRKGGEQSRAGHDQ